MSQSHRAETVVLLRRAADGDVDARDQVWSRLYEEVVQVARAQRRRWSGDWTLDTRVLANEVYIKLFGTRPPSINDRNHFFRILSRATRQILVNYAQKQGALKRGGGSEHVTLAEGAGIAFAPELFEPLLDLHEALLRFEAFDPRAARVVELRFFSGLNYDEIAEALDISRATAVRDWVAARSWLHRELGGSRRGHSSEPGRVEFERS